MIPYGHHDISQDDIEAVVAVLRSDFLTQGPCVPAFESAVARYCGTHHAVAANSATSALHIACLALGVQPGDWVWTTPITFVASANCALYCGAQVDFVDIDPRTYNMSVERLEEALVRAQKEERLPKVVIPVHLCGQPCDMEGIRRLADRYGFAIIEDASHAIGGRYKGEPIGNCRYSDITVFSFHPVKIITSAEGGMALTNDAALAKRLDLFRSHGITRDPEQMVSGSHGGWYYEQIALGYNYRMTDMQAALGLSQMKRLDEVVARRHEIARRYDRLLAELPVVVPWQHPDGYSGLHLYVARVKLDETTRTHRQVYDAMREADVGVNVHYIPVHRQPYYQRLVREARYPQADAYYAEAITLPMYPTLTDAQQDHVVRALDAALTRKERVLVGPGEQA
jgi:UDP-4-amino-4,6-dideoxy-N-acetyl-beta-L-altrosamine transaminase